MEGPRSGETEIQDQPDDQDRRTKHRQHRNGNDWNHEFWNVPGLCMIQAIELIQVRVVVVYRKTKVFLLFLSDRLLDLALRC